MTFPDDIMTSAASVIEACRGRGWMLGTAESCTGGLISGALTAVPGSSDVVWGGFITYANGAKIALLGVEPAILQAKGAVSEEVALAMATGALDKAQLDLTISVTGIAGPDGGTDDKSVGLVHFGLAWRKGGEIRTRHEMREFGNIGRDQVREETVRTALSLLAEVCRIANDA